MIVGHHKPYTTDLLSSNGDTFKIVDVSAKIAESLDLNMHAINDPISGTPNPNYCPNQKKRMIKIEINACFTADPDITDPENKSYTQQFHDLMERSGIVCAIVGHSGLLAPVPVKKGFSSFLKFLLFKKPEKGQFSTRHIPVSTHFYKDGKWQGVFSWNPFKTIYNIGSLVSSFLKYLRFDNSHFKQKIKTTNIPIIEPQTTKPTPKKHGKPISITDMVLPEITYQELPKIKVEFAAVAANTGFFSKPKTTPTISSHPTNATTQEQHKHKEHHKPISITDMVLPEIAYQPNPKS